MFLSQSGADFLESQNAKKIDENRAKLAQLEADKKAGKYQYDPRPYWREKIRLKGDIVQAEIWLKKQQKNAEK